MKALECIASLMIALSTASYADTGADIGGRDTDPDRRNDKLVTVFGSLRPEAIAVSPEVGDLTRRMDDGYSRIGVRGETRLSDDWLGFYRYERRVSANDGESDGATRGDHNELRQVHVGVRGAAGTIAIGRHYGLYYDFIDDELDRHRSHYSDAIVFGDLFVSNAILYSSPPSERGTFGVLIELNDADADGNAVDERIELAGTLKIADISLHAGYVSAPDHDGLFGVALSRNLGPLTVAGVFQQFDHGATDEQLLSLAVDADAGQDRTARLAVTRRQDDPDNDELYLIAGVDQRLSPHLLGFVELYSRAGDRPGTDESALVSGFRFDF